MFRAMFSPMIWSISLYLQLLVLLLLLLAGIAYATPASSNSGGQ
jgi:uncharacterized protein (UPF0333 family)